MVIGKNMLGKPKILRYYTIRSSNFTTHSTGGRNARKEIEAEKIIRTEIDKKKKWKLKETIVRDAFCRKVVEKRSEREETFDDMVACSCRVGKVARKCVAD